MALPLDYPTLVKTCPHCTSEKSVADFYVQLTCKDGLSSWCKECVCQARRTYQREHRAEISAAAKRRHRQRRIAAPIDPTRYVQLALFEQVCRLCGLSRPLDNFGVNRARPKGRHAWCLDCCHADNFEKYHRHEAARREAVRARYWADPAKHRLIARTRYWATHERSLAIGRQYEEREHACRIERKRARYKRERLLICARASEYGRTHRPQIRQRERAAYAANPTRYLVKHQRRRARLMSLPGSFTLQDLHRIYEEQGGLCFYCGRALNGRYHIEHRIPITRPGSSGGPENIACSCGSCNSRKGTMTDEEFIAKMKARGAAGF